jgi:hypothetical protein
MASVADAPFNDTEPHDTILRSKDGVNFYVYKVILSVASPFFRQMFSLPQPNGSIGTITVTEDSQTLDRLLRLCYPVPDPIIKDLTDISDVLEAAMKYEMEEATALMRVELLTFVNDKPLQVFAVACRLMLEEEAQAAAGSWKAACPKVFSKPDSSGSFPDWSGTSAAVSYLPEMSAGAYFRLLRFIRDGMDASFVNADPRDKPTIAATTTALVLQPLKFKDADIVLRSSDGFYFHVHKVIISMMSSDLLDNESTMHDDLPVFDVPEDGRTLSILLELCYPICDPDAVTLDPPDLCTTVLKAAQKYKCSRAISMLKRHFMKEIKKNPLHVYFAAIQIDWDEGAQEAAICAAGRPIEDVYVPEMEFMSADIYRRLLKYCHGHRSIVASMGRRFQGGYKSNDHPDYDFWSVDIPSWWYLDTQDESDLPLWVIAPAVMVAVQNNRSHYNAYYDHYDHGPCDSRSLIHGISKLAKEELSQVGCTPFLSGQCSILLQIKLEIDQPVSHTRGGG